MRKSLVSGLVLAFVLSFVPKADAALILAVDVNGSLACATDNNSTCTYGTQLFDTNPLLGVLSLDATTIGGVDVEGSLHTQEVSPGVNQLSSSSLSITNLLQTTALVQASIGATDFQPLAQTAELSGSGTWVSSLGSSTTFTYYNDPTNQQGGETATDRPGDLLASFSDVSTGGRNDAFSFSQDGIVVFDPFPFSMTLGFDMTLLGGDSLISRGQTIFKDQTDVSEVPEPMSMVLLGTGLLGGGYLKRRQKKA